VWQFASNTNYYLATLLCHRHVEGSTSDHFPLLDYVHGTGGAITTFTVTASLTRSLLSGEVYTLQ